MGVMLMSSNRLIQLNRNLQFLNCPSIGRIDVGVQSEGKMWIEIDKNMDHSIFAWRWTVRLVASILGHSNGLRVHS